MRLAESFRTSLGEAARNYHLTLMGGSSRAADYLQGRGIDGAIAATYQLGVVDGSSPEHEMYKGMLCIPYRTSLGGVVSLKFRRAHDCTSVCEHSKYISPYPTRMFNPLALDRADREGYVFITEGEIDAILLDYAGFPAVGCPGSQSWQAHPEWVSVLAGYSRLFVPYDRDEAGRGFLEAIRSKFRPGVVVPAGFPGEAEGARDVGDGWRLRGGDEFRAYYAAVVQEG